MKKLILMLLMAACCLITANAQKTVVSQTDPKVFDTVEQMPEYPGGMQAMIEFLQANMKYPEDAAKQKVEGRVMVQFVVETDGSVTDVHVAKQVFPSLDAEAIRAEEGNLRYDYFFSKDDPETVLLIDSWAGQKALDAHHATPMMKTISSLREKYGLTMRAERYYRAEEDLTENDSKYIRDR